MNAALRTLTLSAGLLSALLWTGLASAERGGFGHHGGGPSAHMIEEHAEALGLSDEQLAAIRSVADKSRSQSEALRAKLDDAHATMRDLLQVDQPDEAAVMAQAERIGALETERRKLRLRSTLDIRSQLTQEQRAQLVALRQERRDAHFQKIEAACGTDVARLCPNMERGHELFRCLRSNADQLSEGCREAMPHRGHGKRGPHGDGKL
jgi:Spy/CpxP family protein refolding chaperone